MLGLWSEHEDSPNNLSKTIFNLWVIIKKFNLDPTFLQESLDIAIDTMHNSSLLETFELADSTVETSELQSVLLTFRLSQVYFAVPSVKQPQFYCLLSKRLLSTKATQCYCVQRANLNTLYRLQMHVLTAHSRPDPMPTEVTWDGITLF